VQLDTPPASIASNAHQTSAFLLLFHPSGNSSKTQATGTSLNAPCRFKRALAPDCPTEIPTVTLPVTPPFSVSVLGLKRQIAFAGSVPHAKVKVP
jgi:hypothetical protein